MITTRLIFLAVLLALVLFFIYMKFNAPRGPHYRLKLIQFNIDPNVINETGELGKRKEGYASVGSKYLGTG